MSLPDEVTLLYQQGKIQRRFRVADIEKHLSGRFSLNYIRTALANFAKDTGNYVKRWSKARFKRVGPGLYEIY